MNYYRFMINVYHEWNIVKHADPIRITSSWWAEPKPKNDNGRKISFAVGIWRERQRANGIRGEKTENSLLEHDLAKFGLGNYTSQWSMVWCIGLGVNVEWNEEKRNQMQTRQNGRIKRKKYTLIKVKRNWR